MLHTRHGAGSRQVNLRPVVDAVRQFPENLRAAIAIGKPTQIMWIAKPITINFSEKEFLRAAESGRTTSCMKK
jgi:hypothetical protein